MNELKADYELASNAFLDDLKVYYFKIIYFNFILAKLELHPNFTGQTSRHSGPGSFFHKGEINYLSDRL